MRTVLFFILSTLSFASNAISSGNEFVTKQALPINSLMIGLASAIGLTLFGLGLHELYKGQKQSNHFPFGQCVAKMFTGVMLLLSSSIYNAVVNTFGVSDFNGTLNVKDSSFFNGGVNDILASNSAIAQYLPTNTIYIIFSFMYLAGLWSFLKGIFMLKDIGSLNNGGNQGSPLGRSAVHVIAGVILMNIIQFSCIVGSTLGYAKLCV